MKARPVTVERRVLQLNRRARGLLYGAIALGFLAAACWVAVAALLGVTVARVFVARESLQAVLGLFGVMLCLLLGRAALMWASDVTAQHAANQLKGDLRGRILHKLLRLGPVLTRGERTGELVYAATGAVEALDEYMSQFQPARWLAGLVPALVFVVILVLDPWTLPILLFAGPILLILLALIGSRTRELSDKRFAEMSWMSAHFLDMLQGLESLKLFGRSREQAATIETISRQYARATMDVLRTAFQTSLVLEWGATAATALVAIEVSVRLMSGLMPFDRALVVLLLTPEFFLPMRQLAVKYHAGTAGKAAAERIFALLAQPESTPSAPAVEPAPALAPPARYDIRFDNVSAAFDGGERVALNGLNLLIPEGQTVALVGTTGAGKSTVANLLLRFVEPTRGTISVGGTPLARMDAAAWRERVGWVPQHPYLFQGTVAENLRLAKPNATQRELEAAARMARADEFIATLPNGYETLIGENGARLSGGQRQRLAIARALLRDAPVLVFDEITSHLDAANQQELRTLLRQLMGTRTILVITHRLALAYDAHQVAVLEAGRVVDHGAPHALLDSSERYRHLVAAFEGAV